MSSDRGVVPPRHHYRYLDGLRAYLALYVVAHHCFQTAFHGDISKACLPFQILNHGHYAVCFFIVLSGFCLTLPVLKTDLMLSEGCAHFFKRRAWRILPPYYFALLTSLLLIFTLIGKQTRTGTQWAAALPVTAQNVITHLLLVHNFFPSHIFKINYPFWSIAVEWQIYFFFPLLLFGARRFGTATCAFAAVPLSLLIEEMIWKTGAEPSFYFLGLFALGMLAAEVSFSKEEKTSRWKKFPWTVIAGIFLATFALLAIEHAPTPSQTSLALTDIAFGAFSAALLIVASLNPRGWVHYILSLQPFAFIGSFAYSLYLLHAPIVQIVWQYPLQPLQKSPNLMMVVLLFTGIAASVLISYLFFLLGERPFLKRSKFKQADAGSVVAIPEAQALP